MSATPSHRCLVFFLFLISWSLREKEFWFDFWRFNSLSSSLCYVRCSVESVRSTFGTIQHRTGCRSDRYQNLWRYHEFPGERLRDFSEGIYKHTIFFLASSLFIFVFPADFHFSSNHCHWCVFPFSLSSNDDLCLVVGVCGCLPSCCLNIFLFWYRLELEKRMGGEG